MNSGRIWSGDECIENEDILEALRVRQQKSVFLAMFSGLAKPYFTSRAYSNHI